MMNATPLVRFNSKHRKDKSGCWLWTGSLANKGYGRIMVNGINLGAHCLSWVLYRGEIKDGLCVLHKCDVRNCVNPDHLFLGTKADNCRDRSNKGRNVNVRGERHGRVKLTASQVMEIRQSKLRGSELARRYEVAHSTIHKIIHRQKWTHL